RRILGRRAAVMLAETVPAAVHNSLFYEALPAAELRRHVAVVEDAEALREQLQRHGLVAFVADGAILPRRSGVDQRPMPAECAVPFQSPESLRVTLQTPNSGPVTGMGVPAGVTLIVGGGYHGKSTLLQAIERGVYNHIPGDGRERVVAVADAVKVRAESGRHIAGTDVSNFIGSLPSGQDTTSLVTDNASGSTSQAAAIIEALELGAACLLIDEDTSATNLMIRDARMQELIADEFEPITPYIDRARHLADELGVSSILVVGGAGDYFEVADTVIAMRRYLPADLTGEARAIAQRHPSGRRRSGRPWNQIRTRAPMPESVPGAQPGKRLRIRVIDTLRMVIGGEEVDLRGMEQLVEPGQVRAIAHALVWAARHSFDGRRSVRDALRTAL
ncbi:MAG TPA: ATPase, partial [Planctomycetaceae bacterium]|nr:ATPase [Planctomycetaceae bacterium]